MLSLSVDASAGESGWAQGEASSGGAGAARPGSEQSAQFPLGEELLQHLVGQDQNQCWAGVTLAPMGKQTKQRTCSFQDLCPGYVQMSGVCPTHKLG